MMFTNSQLAAAGLAMMGLARPALAQNNETWTVNGFDASYRWENDKTATLEFDLNVPSLEGNGHCSATYVGLEVLGLPNVTHQPCERVGFVFDFLLSTGPGGIYLGAELNVTYDKQFSGTHWFPETDFVLVPYYEEDGTQHTDIEYRGPGQIDLDMQ
ncbi:hypothetical protein KJ359_010041 [Pestalotiopsis sp. 9143b]|nr:hypothetical protein KJ359_010041 [Pestalotiopsis sp. 9143b]